MRWLSVAGKKTLDGKRPGWGINPVAVDDMVVGAATAKWTTAPMKRDDAMKGSWSGTVDERRSSLTVDGEKWGFAAGAERLWRPGISNGEKGAMGGGEP